MKNRRDFLKTVASAGAASGLVTQLQIDPAQAQTQSAAAETTVSAMVPSSRELAMETEPLDDYTESESARYFVRHPNSDFMVDVIKSLGIQYIAANCASSFRGLQESIVNYGGNKNPEFLTCCHEESSVGIAHGYSKIALKPMAIACHGTVGLQHATMAVYNAYCDRAPVIIFAGNHVEATGRRPGAEWSHSALDPAKLVRDFTKWDDQPASMPHFVESLMRAYKIATTPPMGPVVIALDGHLQEEEFHNTELTIPKFSLSTPPQGEVAALREAARMLVNAERPVIVAGRVARTPEAIALLVELAELLQAPVSGSDRMNFPNDHYLSAGGGTRGADVILGMEANDFWSSVYDMKDLPIREVTRSIPPGVKLIHIGVNDLFMKANYQNFQRYLPVDLSVTGDAQASLPTLIEEVKRAMTPERRSKIAERADQYKKALQQARENTRRNAARVWNLSPVSLDRIGVEMWNLIKNRDWSVVSGNPPASRLWTINRYYHTIGGSGGGGQGYGPPASVGAALANRDQGRISINFQSDGDMMYAPGALWTAAHHRVPLLSIMHNNRAYHQEVMHLQRIGARRQRGTDGTARIGNTLQDPFIDYAALAKSMGVWSTGPISDPNEVGPALKRALEVVDRGEPAMVDVVCQPR
jgi:thiamine pyrophosphate-dependent acetolactate synthase large subunit-like protein